MTPRGSNRPKLYVEGRDDFHSIVHLLNRHDLPDAIFPEVQAKGGIEKLLPAIETAVPVAEGRPVGFVFDADSPLSNRWNQVGERFERVGLEVPPTPPQTGFIGESARYKTKVGAWLMPDNQRDGALEDFLRELIENDDAIIDHAEKATDKAVSLGAGFSEDDRLKAVIHTWLAWQETPGRPYGTAITAHYFGKDSEAARGFVEWIKSLYAS